MRWIPIVLFSRLAAAQTPSLDGEAHAAHDAAARGDCELASTLAARIHQESSDVYASQVLADPVIASCVPVLAPPSVAPTKTQTDPDIPPLSAGRLAGELLAGVAVEAGVGVVGGLAGFGIAAAGHCSGEFCEIGGLIAGAGAGIVLGAPLGVYLVGQLGDQHGSFGAAFGGSGLGMLLGLTVATATHDPHTLPLLFALPVAGSMLGFNLTRRYDKHVKIAPIAYDEGDHKVFGVAGRF